MEEMLKKVLLAGVGLASMAAEKVEQTVNDLVEKGKLNDVEGKRIIDAGRNIVEDFFKQTEHRKEEFEEKFKKATESVVTKFDYVHQRDLDAMLARIEAIEAKLGISHATEVVENEVSTEKVEEVVAEEVN
ncbi:MAG: phasin family protein [Bacteroidia bacterium]